MKNLFMTQNLVFDVLYYAISSELYINDILEPFFALLTKEEREISWFQQEGQRCTLLESARKQFRMCLVTALFPVVYSLHAHQI